MPDLAPGIHRQRLVIEGLTQQSMTAMMLKNYLAQLAVELDMVALTDPVLHRSETYGWAGWMHWETSGCHVYAWDDEGFFSVDIYTCKVFRNEDAVAFTKAAFEADTIVQHRRSSRSRPDLPAPRSLGDPRGGTRVAAIPRGRPTRGRRVQRLVRQLCSRS